MNAEVHENMPIGQYHALERLSASSIGALLRSPAHYQAERERWAVRTPSKAMRIGSAVHLLVLEPHLAPTHLPVAPVVNKRTKAGRAEFDAWQECLHPDAIVLDQLERTCVERTAAAILAHPGIQRVGLLAGESEVSILWDQHGAPMKCRPDMVATRPSGGTWLVDIKTSEDASVFDRDAAKWGYHRQAALYCMGAAAAGMTVEGMVFVVAEKSAPHGVRAVTLDSTSVLQGEREVMRAVELYRKCTEAGEWPCYDTGLETLSIPTWAIDKED